MKKPRYRVFTRSLTLRQNATDLRLQRFLHKDTKKLVMLQYTINPSYQMNCGYELV